MWLQPPPPVTNRWVLHIAATPHEVDDVLTEVCIHKRARPIGDPEYPAYLAGRESPYEPPAWMTFARAELERRGYRTQWCEPGCAHRPWPPRTEPAMVNTIAGQGRDHPGRPAGARRATRRTALRRLTTGVPHHHRTVGRPADPARPSPSEAGHRYPHVARHRTRPSTPPAGPLTSLPNEPPRSAWPATAAPQQSRG